MLQNIYMSSTNIGDFPEPLSDYLPDSLEDLTLMNVGLTKLPTLARVPNLKHVHLSGYSDKIRIESNAVMEEYLPKSLEILEIR